MIIYYNLMAMSPYIHYKDCRFGWAVASSEKEKIQSDILSEVIYKHIITLFFSNKKLFSTYFYIISQFKLFFSII